jgi:DNA polymerase eta
VREVLLQRYPYLAHVPPDAPDGVDSPLPPPPPISWNNAGEIIPVNPPPEPAKVAAERSAEVTSTCQLEDPDEDISTLEEEDDSRTTWHDVALSIASEMMMKARQSVLTQLGYSTSAVGHHSRCRES